MSTLQGDIRTGTVDSSLGRKAEDSSFIFTGVMFYVPNVRTQNPFQVEGGKIFLSLS